jgi:hypothetical protein
VWPGFDLRGTDRWVVFRSSAWHPRGRWKSLDIPLLSADTLQVLDVAFTVSTLCALLGLFYPVTALGSAVLWCYLGGLPHQFGKLNHDQLLFFALFVFAFARAADVWSLDAWWRARRGRPPPAPSGEYRWPVRFVALLICTMYCAAGCSKLLRTGWDWALSDSFQRQLLRHHFSHDPPTQIGIWLADFPGLCQAAALGALLVELSCPLALLGKWPYRILMPALGLLQLGIWLLMGVYFGHMAALFACLLPWHEALPWVDRASLWIRLRLARAPA